MIVAGATHKIYAFETKACGSKHDALVYRESDLYQLLSSGQYMPFDGAVIVGDLAYPVSSLLSSILVVQSSNFCLVFQGFDHWLATPFPSRYALNDPDIAAYNVAFKKARIIIENTIGILKRRFTILSMVLPFRGVQGLRKAGMVIQALMAIHNLVCEDREDDITTL